MGFLPPLCSIRLIVYLEVELQLLLKPRQLFTKDNYVLKEYLTYSEWHYKFPSKCYWFTGHMGPLPVYHKEINLMYT